MSGPLQVVLVITLSLILHEAVALEAPTASRAEENEWVWGRIHCDPAHVPDLSISLNGAPLSSVTLLPALPPKGTPEKAPAGAPGAAVQPAVEFRLPQLLPGSYLLEVMHPDLIFPKYRAVVSSNRSSSSSNVEMFRLNEYLMPGSTTPVSLPLNVGPLGPVVYFPVQGSFSVWDLLKQPFVILILVSLAIMYFLPKMRAEEERQQQLQLQQQLQQQDIVDNCYTEAPESLFVAKLVRHGA